jgi:hypothetical protein
MSGVRHNVSIHDSSAPLRSDRASPPWTNITRRPHALRWTFILPSKKRGHNATPSKEGALELGSVRGVCLGEASASTHRMKNLSLVLAALLLSTGVAAAQNAPAPRLDGEGINMDAAPPPTAEPHHPADPLAPHTANPPKVGTTTGEALKDDRFPADRGDTRPVPNAPK